MRGAPPAIHHIRQLDLACRLAIPSEFLDENAHVNVQYYLHLAERGIGAVFQSVGMGEIYAAADRFGNFALEQHIRYYAEILAGDEVGVYARLLEATAKRAYMIVFLVNETRGELAATVEGVMMNIDMARRRGAPFPAEAKTRLDALLDTHRALEWEAPVCGVMRA